MLFHLVFQHNFKSDNYNGSGFIGILTNSDAGVMLQHLHLTLVVIALSAVTLVLTAVLTVIAIAVAASLSAVTSSSYNDSRSTCIVTAVVPGIVIVSGIVIMIIAYFYFQAVNYIILTDMIRLVDRQILYREEKY